MAPKPLSPEIMPVELDLGNGNNVFLSDKSPKKPRRQMSEHDLAGLADHVSPPPTPTKTTKPPSAKSLSSGTSSVKRKKKKKKKSIASTDASLGSRSNHSNDANSNVKKKKKKDPKKKKKKKKKERLTQSDHTPFSEDIYGDGASYTEELPLNDAIPADSPHRLPSRRRRKAKPSRFGSLKRNNSLPTLTGSESDGDSTLEGSYRVGAASFSNFNEFGDDYDVPLRGDAPPPPPRNGPSSIPSEIEAFLDQIIIDAQKPKSPQTSLRKKAQEKARGRSRIKKKKQEKKQEDRPEFVRANSASNLEGDDDDNLHRRTKPGRKRCSSDADRVISLSIAGQGEKTFELSEDDLGMIEAFLENKAREKEQQEEEPISPVPSQGSSTKKNAKRSTSASRAAKRAELFDKSPQRISGSQNINNDELLHSERMDSIHKQATMLPQTRLAKQMRRMSGSQMRRLSGSQMRRIAGNEGRALSAERLSITEKVVSQPSHIRSKSVGTREWRDMHSNRLSLLELESMSSNEGSFSLGHRSNANRSSMTDSSLSSCGLLQLPSTMPQTVKKDLDTHGPFNARDSLRKARKPGAVDSVDGDDYTGIMAKKQQLRRSSRNTGKVVDPFSPFGPEIVDAGGRRSRSGGKRPKKSGFVSKSLVGASSDETEEDEDDEIVNSPGILRKIVDDRENEKLVTDDEASNIDVSFKGLTVSSKHVESTSDPKTPSRQARQTVQRGSRNSTPNGAHVYALDLGEARWTTTPTKRAKKNRQKTNPLDLHLPFSSDDAPSGILKTSKLGLVEPSTFRNSAIRNKKRLKKKGIEAGDILLCDEDNNTVVSDITEAVLDSSLRSNFSTSARSTDQHDEYEEPLRDKWEPNIEQIAEANSQAELHSSAELSVASPSELKDEMDDGDPTTTGGTGRFKFLKKFASKKKIFK